MLPVGQVCCQGDGMTTVPTAQTRTSTKPSAHQ
jgi:hypothetical protein